MSHMSGLFPLLFDSSAWKADWESVRTAGLRGGSGRSLMQMRVVMTAVSSAVKMDVPAGSRNLLLEAVPSSWTELSVHM